MSNVKNYTEQGGDKTVIGGTLEIKSGAVVTGMTGHIDIPVAANQAASVATDAAGLVTDFNALLSKLKAAGIMAADE
ncbi:MAG: Head fiber protein [Saccharofermentanales bacterium]